ncbi:hypothetical protein SRB5_24460 [Streptomyces sp. RB5]|uniref:Secreted protein n=1 Tax=Streptomyces smaragdinus TaxID=2585196 RepID=A0A7K0CG01_9ACTN|nr:hypothetical protein [Streptomyces smaragdinus]MQY12313.1 hypothetical protein [Streptomyces smaragdinus]
MSRFRQVAAACAAAVSLTFALPGSGQGAEPAPRVDLRLLVVDDGGPAVAALADELRGAGTPYTAVRLDDPGRPRIDAAFLADTADGRRRAKFQAVVLPNDNPFGAGSAEMSALATYEKTFGVRQIDAYTYARPEVGLRPPAYSGGLDGTTARLTAAALSGPFGYLRGAVPFEDNDPSIGESYGYAAEPADAGFTTYLQGPGGGSLLGEYAHDGRRELVVTFVYNQYQRQFRLLARGMVEWATQGIHLGADRNYFAVHVDDVFGADDRWNTTYHCTPGDVDCATAGLPESTVRMTRADAQYARSWSQDAGFTLDMVYNGGGSEAFKAANGGADPLTDQLVADRSAYRWVNHTLDHTYLGCVQDVTAVPWRCTTDAAGNVQWATRAYITQQIADNRTWGQRKNLPLVTGELVTGEHSGLKTLPQQPTDNPNLGPALNVTGVTSLASDNSRESDQRTVGSARTLPRFPMNVFYNAGREAEQTDEYNWLYARRTDGGSGVCEDNPATTTCLPAPLDPATGYRSYIVPLESRIALGHITANNPRPHFVHQSNLAEDRIAYPVLDRVLADYRALFAANTPLVNDRQRDLATELERRAAWTAAVQGGKVTAYRVGDTVTVKAPAGVQITATMPPGTRRTALLTSTPFGTAYAGLLSGWTTPPPLADRVTLRLTDAPAATVTAGAAETEAPAAAKLPLPAGVSEPVPAGPGDPARG